MELAAFLSDHLKRKKAEKPKPRSYFYISEAGKTAYEIYKGMLLRQRFPPKIRRIMEVGQKTHKLVRRYLGEMGFLKASEVKVGDDLFHGYVDAIVHIPYGKPMPLEIKTVGRQEFDKIVRQGMPTWKAYIQAQLYLNYLRKPEKARILFVEANTLEDYAIPLEEYRQEQRMKEFEVRKNPRIIRNTIWKFRRLKQVFVRDGVMLR